MENNSEKILKKVLIVVIVLLLAWSLIYIVTTDGVDSKKNKDIEKQLDRIEEVLYKLQDEYTGEVDYNKAGSQAISSILESTGDPYTRYLDTSEFLEIVNAGSEEYGGIGVHLIYDSEKNCALVISAMPETPAHLGGIEMGDEIVKVEDIIINSIEKYKEAAEALRGKEGTNVKLTIRRGDELLEKELTRKVIKVNNVNSNMFGEIGYIKIVEFEENAYQTFKTEYEKLKEKGMKGLILDLRNNPGGRVDETIKIADMFVPDGDLILKTKYKNGQEKVSYGKDKSKIDIPVIVLINENSASASEILASCLKDYKVATLMGQKSYGKGIVQGIEKLQNNDGISITIAKYYTKSNAEIHKKGIEPDIKVEVPEEESKKIVLSTDGDTMLKKAIEEMKIKIK